jgi:hypothetical protein
MAHVKSRPHPTPLQPSETAIVGILDQCFKIIPLDEILTKHRQEDTTLANPINAGKSQPVRA